MSFVIGLECSRCHKGHDHRELANLCAACRSPLWVRYDLESVGHQLKKTDLLDRPADMWRYLELLPVSREEDIITLGEGYTPLLPLRNLSEEVGLSHLYLKEEGVNPTGSFKARGLATAVSMARRLGAEKLCVPTAGNAGGALAAYSARAGLEAHIFMPEDSPKANVVEARMSGADVNLVDGLISDAGRILAEKKELEGWFDVSTLKEPYRLEGKKTMGYELAEQFGWRLPDVVLYPTGGGTGLIGMWKAFEEMGELGWIPEKRPRMVAVQSEGCAPIVRAFQAGARESSFWKNAETLAIGIRVPEAIGDFLILDTLRQSRGCAVAVSEFEIYEAIRKVGKAEGIFLCPEGAACWAALVHLVADGRIGAEEEVVIFNTGAGNKYIDVIENWVRENLGTPN